MQKHARSKCEIRPYFVWASAMKQEKNGREFIFNGKIKSKKRQG